jgi:hypothetical protein
MTRPSRLISLLPIFAIVPRLGLVVLAADRQSVTLETRSALLWISSAALAALVGLAEVYVGMAVVSRRHAGLALLWVAITVVLNALVVPLSISGLEAIPLWQILSSRPLQVTWGAGLGLLSTLCVCGCLWADVVREGSGLARFLRGSPARPHRGGGGPSQRPGSAGRARCQRRSPPFQRSDPLTRPRRWPASREGAIKEVLERRIAEVNCSGPLEDHAGRRLSPPIARTPTGSCGSSPA